MELGIRLEKRLFSELLMKAEQTHGTDEIALLSDEESLSYRELRERVDGIAAALVRDYGIRPSDRVSIIGTNSVSWIVFFFAVVRAGGIAVLENPGLRGAEITAHYENLEVRLILLGQIRERLREELNSTFSGKLCPMEAIAPASVDSDTLKLLDDIERARGENAEAVNMFTSGSTAKAKAVKLTQEGLLWNAERLTRRVDAPEQAYNAIFLPFFHIGGLTMLWRYLIKGGTTVLPRGITTDEMVRVIGQYAVHELFNIPMMFTELTKHPGFGEAVRPHIRLLVSAGADLGTETMMRLETLYDAQVLNGYGITENGGGNAAPALTTSAEKRYASLGKALDDIDICISPVRNTVLDPVERLPAMEQGEILIKSRSMMKGYVGMSARESDINAEGYFHTGDIGYLDEEGCLYIVGRKKNIIIKAGENILSGEIEAPLKQMPGVKDAVVVGVPDEKYGEEIAACLILEEGASITLDAVASALEKRLTRLKHPGFLFYYESFPLLAGGKLDLQTLKEDAIKQAEQERRRGEQRSI